MKKQKKLLVQILVFLTILLSSCNVFATDISNYFREVEYSEEYQKYLNLSDEERQNIIAPRMYNIPKSKLVVTNPLKLAKLARSSTSLSYSLRDYISENVKIRNQQNTNSCWTFSCLGALETNLALKDYKNNNPLTIYDFSERHMDYATSQSFLNNATNPIGFNRQVGNGGIPDMSIAYLTNGSGAVAETSLPFVNNQEPININDINKEVVTQVNDYIKFPSYSKSDDKTQIIQQMKEHLYNHGGIDAYIHGGSISLDSKVYNNDTGAIYCNSNLLYGIDHAVTIIGWDDEYPVENFVESNRPQNPGAWIIKNSWGEEERHTLSEMKQIIFEKFKEQQGWTDVSQITDEVAIQVFSESGYTIENNEAYLKIGDNGFMYVSYEDANIYLQLSGIQDADNEKTYENIYQYDILGGYYPVTFNMQELYLATVFNKKTTGDEYITEIGINAPEQYTCTVYVNPNGTSKLMSDLQPVELKTGDTQTIEAGYHVIEFKNPVKINSNNFVIAVKVKGTQENSISILTEMKFNDYSNDSTNAYNVYNNVIGESGKCFYTYENTMNNGNVWYDASQTYTLSNGIYPNGDTTIKAFTVSKIFENIEITTPPTKTSYLEGENFDATGMVVKAVYSDGTSEEITDYTISNGEDLTLDQKEVIIGYEGKTTIQSIEVVENAVESITITTPPTKTEYLAGEDFDATGMVVEATYTDGTTETVADYTITDGSNLKNEQISVTIEYEGKNTTQEITVEPNIVVKLEITQEPSKTKYVVGQNFDATGMVVKATYESGLEKEVTDYTIQDGEELQEGQTTVTIQYEGITVQQNIIVEVKTVTDISIKTMPSKTEYIQNNEELNLTGGVIVITYNDGTKEEMQMTSKEITVTGFNNKVAGDNTITLTYEDKTVQFKVQIKELPKPVNSKFENVQANVKKIKVYTYSNSSQQINITVDVEFGDIIKATENEKMEYYYYLSMNPSETNITNWTKIEDAQMNGNKMLFGVSTIEMSNYESLVNANNIYIYIKEVATRNNMTSEVIKSSAVSVGNVIVEQYLNGEKVRETDIQSILGSLSGNLPNNTTPPGNNTTTNPDDTTASGNIPHAGRRIFMVFLALMIFVIGRVAYLRYKDIQI